MSALLAYIQTTPWHEERYARAKVLKHWLMANGADALLVPDRRPEEERRLEPTGFQAFVRALEHVPEPGVWFIEDDASLVDNFVALAHWEAEKRPDKVLQAYSTEKGDLTMGERWRGPTTFGSNLCVYYPATIAHAIAAYAEDWTKPADRPYREKDILVRSFLTEAHTMYWNIVPNLATPLPGFSVRQGRRFAQPPSLTFEERA